MSKLRANIDNLAEAERLLSAAYPGLNQLGGELQDILNQMDSTWSGEAANIYRARINEYIATINQLQPMIKDLEKYTDRIGNQMSWLDTWLKLNPIANLFFNWADNSGDGGGR